MPDYILYVLLISFILIAFYTDITKSLLPNWLTLSGVMIGILFHFIFGGIDGLLNSFIGTVAGGGILLLLYFFKALGAGDVKLFAAIGALTGIHFTLFTMMYSIIFAGIIGAFILIFRRQFMKKMMYATYRFIGSLLKWDLKSLDEFKDKESTRFPFMYAVLPGVIVTIPSFI